MRIAPRTACSLLGPVLVGLLTLHAATSPPETATGTSPPRSTEQSDAAATSGQSAAGSGHDVLHAVSMGLAVALALALVVELRLARVGWSGTCGPSPGGARARTPRWGTSFSALHAPLHGGVLLRV